MSPPAWAELARQSIAAARQAGVLSEEECAALQVDELLETLSAYQRYKTEFDGWRKGKFPWILSPSAWGTRVRRNQAAERVREIRVRALKLIAGACV